MCGGFATAAADAPVAYHLGRLTTYLTLGAAAGAVGAAVPGPPWVSAAVSLIVLAVFCLHLAGLTPPLHKGSGRIVDLGRRLIRQPGAASRWALGAVTALLPCGLLWAALAMAVGTGHPGRGLLAMAAFWLGTVPLLAGVSAGFRRLAQRSPRARLVLAGAVFTAGAWSITHRVPMADSVGPPPQCHTGTTTSSDSTRSP